MEFEEIGFFIQQGEFVVEQNIDLLKEEIKKRFGFIILKRTILINF